MFVLLELVVIRTSSGLSAGLVNQLSIAATVSQEPLPSVSGP